MNTPPAPPLTGKAAARQSLNISLLQTACGDAIDLALAVHDDDHHRHLRPELLAAIRACRLLRNKLNQEGSA